MSDTDEDALMNGFHYLKALIARHGTQNVADLVTLADRLVQKGEFKNRREAVAAIEHQNNLEVTTTD